MSDSNGINSIVCFLRASPLIRLAGCPTAFAVATGKLDLSIQGLFGAGKLLRSSLRD